MRLTKTNALALCLSAAAFTACEKEPLLQPAAYDAVDGPTAVFVERAPQSEADAQGGVADGPTAVFVERAPQSEADAQGGVVDGPTAVFVERAPQSEAVAHGGNAGL